MGIGEKFYSLLAILFAIMLVTVLILYPEFRQLKILLPLSLFGLMINIIFMFIVLRDIFLRDSLTSIQKILWIIAILIFWPTVLIYLPRYGFKTRKTTSKAFL
jgi:hypothetical protein